MNRNEKDQKEQESSERAEMRFKPRKGWKDTEQE